MQHDKIQLRTRLLHQRNALSALEILTYSNKLIARLQEVSNVTEAHSVLAYISFGTEVNTHGLIKLLLSQGTKEVFVPVVAKEEKRLMISVLHDWSDLSTGSYGILEPREDLRHLRSAADVDLCLVPGVAFDQTGNRIGYGGGYYDRLLGSIEGRTVGLAYSFQVLDEIPFEVHDERVDVVVTEKRIIDCK